MSTASSNLPPRSNARISTHKAGSLAASYAGSYDTRAQIPEGTSYPKLSEKLCSLWVHDDNFSREEVLVNTSFAPKGSLSPGDLVEIAALKSNIAVRDFQDPSRHVSKDNVSRTTSQLFNDAGKGFTIDRKDGDLNVAGPQTDSRYDIDPQKRYVFVVKDMSNELKARYPNLQVSISSHIANVFGFKNRQQVLLSVVDENLYGASHVELSFRDQYLSRADMWRLTKSELSGKSIYKGQKIHFLGTIKATIQNVYLRGRKVRSAFFTQTSKPIFRSESARYILFIQMSKEMWDFDAEGTAETMFNKVINGFLPELFKRWMRKNARHIVSIILFTRVELESSHITPEIRGLDPSIQKGADGKLYKDYFRVVVSEMASGEWASILGQLKREYRVFLRDVSIQKVHHPVTVDASGKDLPSETGTEHPVSVIAGRPSIALHGNILEAINLASSQFAMDYVDRDLVRTGISIVVITPSPGVFEVDYDMLRMTTETLVSNGIGIDLVCLSRMPLHSVPLFKYQTPPAVSMVEEEHSKAFSAGSTPRPKGEFGSLSRQLSNISSSLSNANTSPGYTPRRMPTFTRGKWSYAIPHWIDISFWSRSSNETLHQLDEHDTIRLVSRPGPKKPTNFVARCKMYELQMMGIMENEMSNIAVSYLHDDLLYSGSLKASYPGGPPVGLTRAKETDSAATSASRPSLSVAQVPTAVRSPSEQDVRERDVRKLYRWMDNYDDMVFQPLDHLRNSEKDARRKAKDEKRKAYERLQDDDTLVFGTSFDDKAAPLSSGMPEGAFSVRKLGDSDTVGSSSIRRGSVSSTLSTANTSIKRPTKLARNISFGLRGFGTAPKALATLASTELNVEHANKNASPGPVLHRGFDPGLPAAGHNGQLPHILSRTASRTTVLSVKELSSQNASLEEQHKAAINVQQEGQNTRPIAINAIAASPLHHHSSRADGLSGSFAHDAEENRRGVDKLGVLHAASVTKQAGPKIDLASSAGANDVPPTLSPTSALAPWLTILNPSNPAKNKINPAAQFRRWQHVFPRPHKTSSIKWKSLCSPAAVPLTTEYFPSPEQLSKEYHESLYNISQNEDDDLREDPRSREALFMELIAFRLTQGYQIVVGPAVSEAVGSAHAKILNPYNNEKDETTGTTVFMSMGNIIHQLQCVDEDEVEIKRYVRKPAAALPSDKPDMSMVYRPVIRTMLEGEYKPRQIILQPPNEEYNWNYVDSYVAGYVDSLAEGLRYWRARFVLIPVHTPTSSRRLVHANSEDNEEEVRIEGIRKLTQFWQRYRYIPPDERQYQLPSRFRKDTNPLDVEFQTRDPSVIVAAEVEGVNILDPDPLSKRSHLFSEAEPFQRSSINMLTLAHEIQGDRGVRLMDRRWHWRIHYNCFKGDELTTWLLENFRDIESRAEAVELGNELMEKGLFQHVEKRHQFRDGNYFYQMSGEYRSRPESRTGWFSSRKSDKSMPSTPLAEPQRDSPRITRSRSDSNTDDGSTDAGSATPRAGSLKKMKVLLSRSIRYNVDHRNRSYRPEIINLHYDRLHNPDNCYHIRIDWMNVTSKLIEDAVVAWASIAEKYGLRLVEVPIAEASVISERHPFRAPYIVRLAVSPPTKQPQTVFESTSFNPHHTSDKLYYHKALLRKFNFVLDLEAAKDFPPEVDVSYSWGKPDYRYCQYIHRSGTVLAQILDDGNILILANRAYNNRSPAAKEATKFERSELQERRTQGTSTLSSSSILNPAIGGLERPSPFPSPLLRPVAEPVSASTSAGQTFNPAFSPIKLLEELNTFCSNSAALNKFFEDVLLKAMSPATGTPVTEANIPSLGLPPAITARDNSTSPTLRPSTASTGPSTPRTASGQSSLSNPTE